MSSTTVSTQRGWLSLYSQLVCYSVLLLIFFGALVKSHEAGLAVPDWPTSFGENMFLFPPSKWVGGIFYEHVHRLIASGIGLLTVILTFWLAFSESRRWVRMLAYASLLAVIVQGVLGGLTVIYQLPAAVSVSHGVLAQTFLVMLVIIAYSQSAEWKERSQKTSVDGDPLTFRLSVLMSLLLFGQLILGAIMRHLEAGLAIPDFPEMGGSLLPGFDQAMLGTINEMRAELGLVEADMTQVLVHFLHRIGAIVIAAVSVVLLSCSLWTNRTLHPRISKTATLFLWLVLIQILLGIITVMSVREPMLTSMHVVTGAALLAVTVLLAVRSFTPNT